MILCALIDLVNISVGEILVSIFDSYKQIILPPETVIYRNVKGLFYSELLELHDPNGVCGFDINSGNGKYLPQSSKALRFCLKPDQYPHLGLSFQTRLSYLEEGYYLLEENGSELESIIIAYEGPDFPNIPVQRY